jgi:hypothetical protein
VKILDGSKQIGSATVAANGGWSAKVTLANQGANVLTATDANVAGTGISNAVTYTLHTTAPTVKVTSAGVTTSSAAQTITVVEPPVSASGAIAAALATELLPFEVGHPWTEPGLAWGWSGAGHDHFALATSDLALLVNNAIAGAFSATLSDGGSGRDLAALSTLATPQWSAIEPLRA